jgi:glycosyltransferase involved in cell wall biosynthesis
VSRREGFFLEAVEKACGPVFEMNVRHMMGFDTLREVQRLARHLRDDHIELVHAWDADAAIFGSWAARLAGVPFITSRRDMGQIYSRHKAMLMRQADRGARAIVTNADAIRKRLLRGRKLADKVHVIPNILDVDEFDRIAAKKWASAKWLPPGRRVVMVSRLDAEKDGATFLRAAARVETPDAVFLVVGDGMERHALNELSRSLELGGRLSFLGNVQDVPALLRECHVGVLVPKKNEGLSNSILEYMAAGLPVVATDCGGNREVVEHGVTGHIVPCGEAAAVANAIDAILQNGTHRRARAARRRVEARHRPDVVVARFAQLYRDVVAAC